MEWQEYLLQLAEITKTWWDGSHDWSTALERHKLHRKDQEEEERELPFRAAGVHGALPRYG